MTATAPTLIDPGLVGAINDEHRACEQASARSLEHAIRAGRGLLDVKALLQHGEFGVWLRENFAGSERTARTYMQLAGAPEEDRQRVADLSLRQARDEIAQPRTTQGDTVDLLRQLGGSVPHARAAEQAWSGQQERRLAKALAHLEHSTRHATAATAAGLSGYAVNDTLRTAALEARHAMNVLEELAFSFE